MPIPLPPYKEQFEIAKTILMTENKINHHKAKKEALISIAKKPIYVIFRLKMERMKIFVAGSGKLANAIYTAKFR